MEFRKYFEKESERSYRCTIPVTFSETAEIEECGDIISVTKDSLWNLKRHILRKHETVLREHSKKKTTVAEEFVWTLQGTWHLVNTRLEMEQDFDKPVYRKKKLWEMVAEKVNSKLKESDPNSVSVKAHECDLKWRNLMGTYRKNAERATRQGVSSVHWEFFKAMHDVLGRSRDQVQAERRAKLTSTRVNKAMANKKFTPILPTPSVMACPSSRAPQDVLQLYMELQERKLNMWAQQKALEERKIEAINNLAQAISSLAQKNNSQASHDAQ